MKVIRGDVYFWMKPLSWSLINMCLWSSGGQCHGEQMPSIGAHRKKNQRATSIFKPVCCPQAPGGCLFIFHFNTACERLGAGIHRSCGASSETGLFDLQAKLDGWVETKFSSLFLFSKKTLLALGEAEGAE